MKRAIIFAALVLGLSGPAGAWAQRNPNADENPPPAATQQAPRAQAAGAPAAASASSNARTIPLAQIITQIARSVPGRQLNTTTDEVGGTPVYRINWSTTDGRRIDFVVNALTGRVISQEGG